jgi:hypothetical protein
MRFLLSLLLLVSVAACGRSLTPAESDFARLLFADQIDTTRARFADGLVAGTFTHLRPRVTCTERLWPPVTEEATVTVSPGAMAVFESVHFREDLYRDDFLAGMPDKINLVDAMLFAHEMTHIWQWQNRDRTGYHPLRAAGEHRASADPYLFDTDTRTGFLDHGFEQQGAIVEEYLCCRVLAPDAPRTKRLHAMLSGAFPVARLDREIADAVILPWRGVTIPGICS